MTTDAPEPFDLDAAVAEAEASRSPDDRKPPFRFMWDGAEYTVSAEVDQAVVALLTSGDVRDAKNGLRRFLGDEQWRRLVESPKLFGDAALSAMFNQWAQYVAGVDMGNSSGSSDS
jgi:hypothetical protein